MRKATFWMSERRIYLLGAGGHGRVVLDMLASAGLQLAGIIDPALPPGASFGGASVLGGDEALATLDQTATLALGVGANPHTVRRAALFKAAVAQGWRFPPLAHASAVLGSNCEVGEGCQRMAGSIVQCGTRIGVNVVINTRASVDHDCWIGDDVFISPGVTICGGVSIGEGAFVGAGAVIVPGVTIGAGAVIGAGVLVRRNVEEKQVAVGARADKRADHV
jgi:UDP-perosamine 4-acetyltransferase